MDKEIDILNQSELAKVSGGNSDKACGCCCAYENNGGSSTHDNAWANSAGGKVSAGTAPFKIVVTKDGHAVDMIN